MSWTDEKIEELKKLWAEGLTTGEIGRVLGMSKNAVVGKAHRLELESRPSPIKRDENAVPKAKAKAGAAATTAEAKKAVAVVKEKVAGDKVKLADLTLHSCRWPIGDPKDKSFHFCGKEVIPGKPYCGEHVMAAYVGINKR